ncbi:hypothetical protein ACNTMW_01470 [Planosporangium sp. 12N6]|uniref:hypothetical protein n=1 Tax=Planosporangium spinosum TaxID=3402278 RepID=UPI003CF09BDB
MDRPEVALIKILHRPDMYWLNGEVFAGCSCGTPWYPCETLTAALAVERRMGRRIRDAGRYPA